MVPATAASIRPVAGAIWRLGRVARPTRQDHLVHWVVVANAGSGTVQDNDRDSRVWRQELMADKGRLSDVF
jgi:hypothetical protein